MATASVFAPSLSFLLLLFTGGRLDLPLSLPPLPEDPRLAYIAPEQCLWYLATSGMAKADSKSKNHVERTLAEEDVQRFVREVSAKLKEAFAKATPNDPVRKQLGEEVPKLVELLLTRPLCVYIESIGASPQGPTFRGGLALSLDTRAEEVKASLEKIEQTVHKLANQPIDANSDGWHKLPLPPGAPVVQWSVQEKFLLVGVGENEAGAILTRLKTSKAAPEWLAKIRRELPIERPSVVHYTNLAEGMKLLQPAIVAMHGPEQSRRIIEAFGLQNVKYYASVAGLDGEDFANRALLATDGKPTAFFALLDGKPLAPDALSNIPGDSTFAIAARVDPSKAIETLTQFAATIQPSSGPNPVNEALQTFRNNMGVDLKSDLVDALGDTWTVYNSPDDGGLVFTGLTVTVNIRDRVKLQQAYDKLAAVTKKRMSEMPQPVDGFGLPMAAQKIQSFEYRGQTIHVNEMVGQLNPVAPALCITDKHLIWSLFPQAIKSHLDRQAAVGSASANSSAPQSLVSTPLVKKQLTQKDGPTVLAYQNTPAFFKLLYPLAQIGAQLACSELQKNGIDLNIGMFPNARAIQTHLVPTVTSARTANDGVYMETRGSLPLGAGALPLAAGMFGVRSMAVPTRLDSTSGATTPMPAASLNIGFAPGFAEREASKNKLKQIALAMLNFESAKKSFPQAAIVDKENKPLLSWRVAILPFIEQDQLFKQFKLDEPWDSEHNKKLIEKMPDIYKAPGSKVAGEFKTVYETVRGERTVFPIERAVRLRGITDGSSRTVMAVETSDDKAVVWTKPDDFVPDEENPAAGLVGLRGDVFLAVLCDGRVVGLQGTIPKDVVKAVFTRNGGETIDLDGVVE